MHEGVLVPAWLPYDGSIAPRRSDESIKLVLHCRAPMGVADRRSVSSVPSVPSPGFIIHLLRPVVPREMQA